MDPRILRAQVFAMRAHLQCRLATLTLLHSRRVVGGRTSALDEATYMAQRWGLGGAA